MHLTGTQWGVMNETGSYPGQPWLWLYQLLVWRSWYRSERLAGGADMPGSSPKTPAPPEPPARPVRPTPA